MDKQTIVIIGSTGQLGTDIHKLLQTDYNVYCLNTSNIDISNKDSCDQLRSIKAKCIINTAAYHDAKICETNIVRSLEVNAIGVANLVDVCREISADFIHISTDYVFNGYKNTPYYETDSPNAINVYGRTKALGETIALQYDKSCILRVSALYGHYLCKGKPRPNFVDLMLKLASESKEIKVVDNEFTTPTSTVAVSNQIKAVLKNPVYGIFHSTCEGFCSWYDFAKKIFEIKNIDANLIPTVSVYDPSFSRPWFSILENHNLKKISMNTFTHWEESLRCYLNEK